jgi:hypothetical protein
LILRSLSYDGQTLQTQMVIAACGLSLLSRHFLYCVFDFKQLDLGLICLQSNLEFVQRGLTPLISQAEPRRSS